MAGGAVTATGGLGALRQISPLPRLTGRMRPRTQNVLNPDSRIRQIRCRPDHHPGLVDRLGLVTPHHIIQIHHQIRDTIPRVEDHHLTTIGQATLIGDRTRQRLPHIRNPVRSHRVLEQLIRRENPVRGEKGIRTGKRHRLELTRTNRSPIREPGMEITEPATTSTRARRDVVVVRRPTRERRIRQIHIRQNNRRPRRIENLDELPTRRSHHHLSQQQVIGQLRICTRLGRADPAENHRHHQQECGQESEPASMRHAARQLILLKQSGRRCARGPLTTNLNSIWTADTGRPTSETGCQSHPVADALNVNETSLPTASPLTLANRSAAPPANRAKDDQE